MEDKLQEALDLCNKKEFDKALSIIESLLKDSPDNSEAWRVLAQIHWTEKHEPDKAYDELIEALRCDPKNIWALVLMGNLLTREKNDVEHAKKYYDKVIEFHPDNAIAINNIGATLMELNNFEGALQYLEKALSLDDTYINSYYGLALCYYKLNRLEDSFETCNRGLKKSIDRVENKRLREELLKLYMTVARDLSDATNYINIWKGIKDELEIVDNIPISFIEDKNLNVHAKLEYAPYHAAKEHVLRFNPDKEYVDHLFIHEMMHLKMHQQALLNSRDKAMVGNENTFKAFNSRYRKYMLKAHSHLPADKLKSVMVDLSNGLALQLMNCPLDLFVEHMIYTTYKSVRPIQLLSLFNMEIENINSVKQALTSNFFPKEIVQANKVMNIVTSMHFKEMYGIDLVHEYKPSKNEYAHALDLYEEFKAYLGTYKAGDEYEMMEYFVQSFNMEDFLELTDGSEIINRFKQQGMCENIFDTNDIDDTDVANAQFALDHQDGADPAETMMMSMYMLGAMEYFDGLDIKDVHRIAFEIAAVGVTGIDIKKTYSIPSIPNKEFKGYQFLAYYYVSWARAIPDMVDKLGLPFTKAYETALLMYNQKKENNE